MILHRVGGEGRGSQGRVLRGSNRDRAVTHSRDARSIVEKPRWTSQWNECIPDLIKLKIRSTATLSHRFSTRSLYSNGRLNAEDNAPNKGSLDKQVKSWERVIGRDPTVRSRTALGVLYFLDGDYRTSTNIQLSVSTDATDRRARAIALANATDALTMISEYDLAWTCILKSLELLPDRPATYAAMLSSALLSQRPRSLTYAARAIRGVQDLVTPDLQDAADNRRRRLSTYELNSRISWTSCVEEAQRTCPDLVETDCV